MKKLVISEASLSQVYEGIFGSCHRYFPETTSFLVISKHKLNETVFLHSFPPNYVMMAEKAITFFWLDLLLCSCNNLKHYGDNTHNCYLCFAFT